jgi:hypothetical protein
MVMSHKLEATCFPSGEKATAITMLEWPAIVWTNDAQVSSMEEMFLSHPGILSKFSLFVTLDSGLKMTVEL